MIFKFVMTKNNNSIRLKLRKGRGPALHPLNGIADFRAHCCLAN